jgi:Flp pilus assembly protein TadG
MTANEVESESRKGERGAVSVKAVLIVVFLAVALLLLIKMVPVYIEQQQIQHNTDELARKASLGIAAYSKDKINNEIQSMINEYGLPEGSIQISSIDGNHAEINVKYTRNVDLLLTSYAWDVTYTAVGKGI